MLSVLLSKYRCSKASVRDRHTDMRTDRFIRQHSDSHKSRLIQQTGKHREREVKLFERGAIFISHLNVAAALYC